MIHEQAETLKQEFMQSKIHAFHDAFVVGKKLGEGQHASVYQCFKRVNPRSNMEATTPFKVDKMQDNEYHKQPYAVKMVRSDDYEKIEAHKKEFEILKTLNHRNVVRGIELFYDDFKHEIF